MRLSPLTASIAAFVVAALISGLAARTAVAVVEDTSVAAVRGALSGQGHDWASVQGDGLQVILEGAAPSEALRFRAISVAGGIVDSSRVIDNMQVTEADAVAAPDFAIEILRNDSGVSLIGLIPAASDREALAESIARIADDMPVTDLLDAADYPVPDSWGPSLRFALDALEKLPRSKISVDPGRVEINAISDSPRDQRRLETEIRRLKPSSVRLVLSITAPRPVITPFTARFVIDGNGARFDACSADTEAAQRLILQAATAAGLETTPGCTLGLGVPSGTWGEAVSTAIAALAEIGGGTVTFSDADVSLIAATGTEPKLFDRVVGDLGNALPDVFALEAVLPETPEKQTEGPPEFTATLSEDSMVQLRGRLPDALTNTTAENFARARFGRDKVRMGTRITDGLPADWSVRILAGLDALTELSHGSLTVTPDLVTLGGKTGNRDAAAEISRLMADKLGQGAKFEIDVEYLEALDPIAGLPSPEECVAQIAFVTADRKITFDPGSASISADGGPVIADIAEIVRNCPDLRIEVAGYTDSQGRDEMNLRLSQQRAEAVLVALRRQRVPVGGFMAKGFGEADPIADNGSSTGREANRRIEFRLIPDETDATEDGAEAAVDDADAPDDTDDTDDTDGVTDPETAADDAPQTEAERPSTGPRARPD